MPDRVKEKLSGLLYEASRKADSESYIFDQIADYLIAHGVTVQEECNACAIATQEVFASLQGKIAELSKVQAWISVKDRLPEKEGLVIGYDVQWGVGCFYYHSSIYPTCWEQITHWMPLPQPPKGE